MVVDYDYYIVVDTPIYLFRSTHPMHTTVSYIPPGIVARCSSQPPCRLYYWAVNCYFRYPWYCLITTPIPGWIFGGRLFLALTFARFTRLPTPGGFPGVCHRPSIGSPTSAWEVIYCFGWFILVTAAHGPCTILFWGIRAYSRVLT